MPRKPAKGEITLWQARLVFQKIEHVEKVNKNGKEVIVKKMTDIPVYNQYGFTCDIALCRVITANGKPLASDEAIKRLTPNTVVAVSPNGQTPDGRYMRVLNADTIVIILPPGQGEMMQPPPAPPVMLPPAPPEKQKAL